MPFLSEEFVAAAAALLIFVFFLIVLWGRVVDLLVKYEAHNEKLEALEEHLGIRFVETKKHLVVQQQKEKQS